MRAVDWVALVLLGSGKEDIEGAYHLCASIFHYEPQVVHVLLVCDCPEAEVQSKTIQAKFGNRVSAIIAPPKHAVTKKAKYLGPNVLHGLNFLEDRFDAEFTLKLDADSLIINPFSEQIGEFLASNPQCGVCGTLGRTSSREQETYGFEFRTISPLVKMISSQPKEQWGFISSLPDDQLLTYARMDHSLAVSLRAFSAIAKPVYDAIRHGYHWLEYCQGGGYAVSKPLLRAMRDFGYLNLDYGALLYGLPAGEDVLISMYCRSLGFQVMDYSEEEQPFACMWRGLPYPAQVLIERHHAIVHSLKGDQHASRAELQRLFLAIRKHDLDENRRSSS